MLTAHCFIFSLKATEIPGIKILRFESSLYFGNVERFRNAVVTATGLDPSNSPKRKEVSSNTGELQDKAVLLLKENTQDDPCDDVSKDVQSNRLNI